MSQETIAPAHRDCPYFGLDYYTEPFGAWFFGREAERGKIITNLRATRLTLLHAESGVGKSSLLRAGVAWRLGELARTGETPRDLPVVFSSWKDDPLTALIDCIGNAGAPTLANSERHDFRRGRLDETIEAAASNANANLMVILDQFEDYFLYRSNEPQPERLAEELARCINRTDLPANFLIAIREDAYAGLGDIFKGRIANVYGNYLHIEYLDRAAAEAAIREPLRLYNQQEGVTAIGIEDELVEAVLDQVRSHKAAEGATLGARSDKEGDLSERISPPLLQLVMGSIWTRECAQGSRVLRLSTFQGLEGAERIVDTHLWQALNSMDSSERVIAIDVFDRLVTESGGKVAQAVPDLAHRTHHSEGRITSVLEQLDDKRIVRPVQAPLGLDPVRFRRYEIFHDVLGPALNRAVQSHTETRLLHERNIARQRVGLVSVLALVALLALIAALIWSAQAREARNSARGAARTSLSSALAADSANLISSDVSVASLLGLESYALRHTDESTAALNDALELPLDAILTDGKRVSSVAFSPNGKLMASGDEAGNIVLWNMSTDARMGLPLRDGQLVTSVAFSPNGKLLASGDETGKVTFWDVAKHARVAQPLHDGSAVFSVSFSPNGKMLASGDNISRVSLWNVTTHRRMGAAIYVGSNAFSTAFSPSNNTLAIGDGAGNVVLWNLSTNKWSGKPIDDGSAVFSVAFSPNGRLLASGDEAGKITMWRASTRSKVRQMSLSFGSSIRSIAFSPNGKILASGNYAGKVTLWDVASGVRRGQPLPDGSVVFSVAFSSDGQKLASGDYAGKIVIWDTVAHAREGRPFLDHSTIRSVAFSPHGELLVSGDESGSLTMWSVARRARIGRPLPIRSAVRAVAFSPNGQLLASGDRAGEIVLWNVTTHAQVGHRMMRSRWPIQSLAFSPDGKLLASGDEAGKIVMWNVASTTRVGQMPLPDDGPILALAFSPKGNILASGEAAGNIALWNTTTRKQIGEQLSDGSTVRSLAFDLKGELLASGDDAGNVLLWKVPTGEQFGKHFVGAGGQVFSVTFSPDGRLLASGDEAGDVSLWDPATGSRIGQVPGDGNIVYSVAFSPDDATLAAAGDGGDIELLSSRYGRGHFATLAKILCSEVRANLSRLQWRQYVPDEPYKNLCQSYP